MPNIGFSSSHVEFWWSIGDVNVTLLTREFSWMPEVGGLTVGTTIESCKFHWTSLDPDMRRPNMNRIPLFNVIRDNP